MNKRSLIIYSTLLAMGGSMSIIPAANAFNPMNPGSWFGGNDYDDDYYYDRYYDRYGPYGYGGPYGGWGGPYGGYGPYGYGGYPGYGYGAPGYYPQQQQSSEPPPPPLPQ